MYSVFIQCLLCLCLVCFSLSSPRFQGSDSQQCPPGRRSVQLCLSGGGCLHIPAATQARSESDYRDFSVYISVTLLFSKCSPEGIFILINKKWIISIYFQGELHISTHQRTCIGVNINLWLQLMLKNAINSNKMYTILQSIW